MILRLVACSHNAESVSGSAKSEALAVSLESREKLFRKGCKPQMMHPPWPGQPLAAQRSPQTWLRFVTVLTCWNRPEKRAFSCAWLSRASAGT